MYKKLINEMIPKDVTMGLPMLRTMGFQELYIENYRGMLEYTQQCIRVQTKSGQIRIEGRNMDVEYYNNLEMKIVGQIQKLEFCQGG